MSPNLHSLTISVIFALILLFCFCISTNGQPADSLVREPVVAGKFYPSDSSKLRNAMDCFFADAVKKQRPEKPIGVIAPHAGYIYSGQIAADAFNQTKDFAYDVVVILGTNHTRAAVDRITVWQKGAYRTPFGTAQVDEDIINALMKEYPDVVPEKVSSDAEHSVEVQIPFIQYLFPKARIVPMVIGINDIDRCIEFGKSLGKILKDKNALIVASSDLSHYPSYEDAVKTDKGTLEQIITLNCNKISKHMDEQLHSGVHSLVTCACGESPILTLISAVKELECNSASVINYANSGDTFAGSYDRVVGYGAVAFYNAGQNISDIPLKKEDKTMSDTELTKDEKQFLLKLARKTIEQYLGSGTFPLPTDISPALKVKRGAFVTLRKKHELRGCIGNMANDYALYNVIGRMAFSAAFNDTRFQPVTLDEMPFIEIEISVLTPFEKVNSADDIVLGRDGVLLSKGGRQAVYLPQVATETGWDKETFLKQLCYKAGLSGSDWKTATLYTFRAEVFGEADFK
jgi:MEMO1 family protein